MLLPDYAPAFYPIAVLAILLAGISKGGFGAAAGGLAVPLMSIVIAPPEAAGIMLPILCAMDLFGVHAYRGRWSLRHLRILLPGGLIGIALGGIAFGLLPVNMIRLIVGCVAVLFSLNKGLALTERLVRRLALSERPPGPLLGVMVLTIGGIYVGAFTPVESSGIGAALVILIAFLGGKLDWRSFREAVPDASLRPLEASLSALAEGLRERKLDFALTYDQGADAEGLAFLPLASLRPMVVVGRDHPLADRGAVSLSELAQEPYVLFDAPGSSSYFQGLLAEGGIAPPVAYASTSMESVRSAVAAGLGFTLLVMRPPSDLTYDGGAVRTLALTDPLRPLTVVLASRAGGHASGVTRQFADHAAAWFAARY